MTIFMARLLHAPPSRFSRPSTVPLEVAAEKKEIAEKEEVGEGQGGGGGRWWRVKEGREEGEKEERRWHTG